MICIFKIKKNYNSVFIYKNKIDNLLILAGVWETRACEFVMRIYYTQRIIKVQLTLTLILTFVN